MDDRIDRDLMTAQWDPRLITAAEAMALAGDWPTSAALIDGDIVLLCAKDGCGQSAGQLRYHGTTVIASASDYLSAVLRHMVTGHDFPLDHRRKTWMRN